MPFPFFVLVSVADSSNLVAMSIHRMLLYRPPLEPFKLKSLFQFVVAYENSPILATKGKVVSSLGCVDGETGTVNLINLSQNPHCCRTVHVVFKDFYFVLTT